jgi:hypothetical protein
MQVTTLTSIIAAMSVWSSRRSMRASVSGSPKRTLYSSVFGPASVSIKPVKSNPTNGKPARRAVSARTAHRAGRIADLPYACRRSWAEL